MEPVSAGEIARRLDDMSQSMRDDFGEIKRRMDSYVLREVYTADSRAIQAQLSDLRTQMHAEAAARRVQVRWVWGSVIIPITLAAVALAASVIAR